MEFKHNFEDLRLTVMKKNQEQFREELPYLIQNQILLAKFTKAKYDALISAGFKKDEALFLCKDR